jgi:glycosyltransferase involved in cell wall biosynthesis
VTYEPWALFFGRFQAYKGIEVLLAAAETLAQSELPDPWLVLAGAGNLAELWPHPLPRGVAVHHGQVDDGAGWALFQRCGLVVLPYTGATQSALPAAAYAFAKPVLVSDSGALTEVVMQGQTGWITPSGDGVALGGRLCNALQHTDQLAAMGRAGRAWYEAQRSALPEALTTLYRRTIARN